LRLKNGSLVPSPVNKETTLEAHAHAGAIDQMGNKLGGIIHAFAEWIQRQNINDGETAQDFKD
jgi:hypothetical protein